MIECQDVEAIVVDWLSVLRRTSIIRRTADELPFTLVHHVAGSECIDESTIEAIVSVHTLCDRASGELAARNEAQATHQLMRELGRTLPAFTLPNGDGVGMDYVVCVESPIWADYGDDQILRRVGRYQIGLTYTDSDPE